MPNAPLVPPLRLLLMSSLLLPLLGLSACGAKVVAPSMDLANCQAELEDSFGLQDASVLVLEPRDGGPLFRPDVLEALDRVCQAFEDAMTDDLVALKCLTRLPIMETKAAGSRVVVARDAFPMSAPEAVHFQGLVNLLEFARGDVVDVTGSRRTFIHIPHISFEGVDLRAIYEAQAAAEAETFQMAWDGGDASDTVVYREIAGGGPSASYVVGLFDTGESGGLKNPESLKALERFQVAVEGLPRVTQSFSIADDLKMVRRGLHRGKPSEAYIPSKRAEIAQLMLAQSMAPQAEAFGPRTDSTERVALVRVNLSASTLEQRRRLERRVGKLLQAEQLQGGRAFVCPVAE